MGQNITSPDWVVKVTGLTKSFGNQRALRGIDLEVRPGEFIVIFGPNGAGKSTLLNVLAGIINPSSGSILIGGRSLQDNAEEVRRQIGVVSHQTFLYGNLTAYENLEFYSRMYDVPRCEERIEEVAAIVGMTSRLHDRVSTFSRGMQQRISIARALLHKPAIMLLDEPETGLDQQAIAMLWETLHADGAEKRSIILTSHNLERGFELGERLLVLDKGKIVYEVFKKDLDLDGLKTAYQQSTRVSQ
ncbi:MAG: heme ABC exporter ATP-binding protein CcmA [Chloroflexi bacterium]|nr:heme ABC exporter ATP-binding protein CcmA [Chloroflexota bacterium]